MPLPPRQPYAFASSNPSAASSSQHQLYNRNQQQQRQDPNAPRRGYTAAPGAASAVSLLPHSQRDAGSDSVVRISNRSTRSSSSSGSHCSLFSAALESLQCPSPRSGPHNIRQGKKHAINRHSSLAHSLPGSRAPLDAQDRTTIPVAMCGIPGASSISRKCTTSLFVDLLMAGMPRSTATGSTATGSASNKRFPHVTPEETLASYSS